MNQIISSTLIYTITPDQVSSFLQRKGWHKVEYANKNLMVFVGDVPEYGKDLSVVIPAQKDFADYPVRLRECVNLLSQYYDQPADILIHRIAHWDRDIFKIRVESPVGKEALLPLDFAANVISKYRNFIAFAAATENDPRRFFAKLTGAGTEFVDKCRFGHTFVGSFGLTIECPLNLVPELPIPGLPVPRPFSRAVTERIALGYVTLSTAVRDENPEVLIQSYRTGFSGNMCEILTDIYESLDGRTLSHGMIWAPELPPPADLSSAETPMTIDHKSYDFLKIASTALQTVEEPDEDKLIIGIITRLRSEKPPINIEEFEFAARTIVVSWEMEKQQPLNVHIALPLNLYKQACDAHKDGRKIEVVGKPKKSGKFWELTDYHDFKII
ncbi:MAG: hypothetical protein KJ687_07890 [Proteobacteria bacterium]|nr:hypothetical protein [Pseudomonadota bacterium]